MKPVAKISYIKTNKISLRAKILKLFKEYGYRVDRKNFGTIEIGEKQINRSLDYIFSDSEYAAFMAVPAVLKRGIDISDSNNHKGRGYDTITLAAPVEINGTVGNVGVVVRKTGKNRYYTHRILLPNGSEFVFDNKKTESTSADMDSKNAIKGTAINSVSNTNYAQKSENVNSSEEKNSFALSADSEGRTNPTASEDIRYALSDVDTMTEKQYNSYGWAFVGDVLDKGISKTKTRSGRASERVLFFDKIGELNNKGYFPQTREGEYLIAVNNKIIYTDGENQTPAISKILVINTMDGSVLDEIGGIIYENERLGGNERALQIVEDNFGKGNIVRYARGDFQSYREIKRQRKNGSANNADCFKQRNGRRDNREGKYALTTISPAKIVGSDKVLTTMPNTEITVKDVISGEVDIRKLSEQSRSKLQEWGEHLQIIFTNSQAGIEHYLKRIGSADAAHLTNYVRAHFLEE